MTYDRADWHYGGRGFGSLPQENGATHFGMFLAWAIKRGLVGAFHLEHNLAAVEEVQRGGLSGRGFVFQCCDEKLTPDDLNDEGNEFTSDYYRDYFFRDYAACFGDEVASLYEVPVTPKNQEKLDAVLDRRLDAWRSKGKAGLTDAK